MFTQSKACETTKITNAFLCFRIFTKKMDLSMYNYLNTAMREKNIYGRHVQTLFDISVHVRLIARFCNRLVIFKCAQIWNYQCLFYTGHFKTHIFFSNLKTHSKKKSIDIKIQKCFQNHKSQIFQN